MMLLANKTLTVTRKALFCSVKEEYSRYFLIKLCFGPDGYYESSTFIYMQTNTDLTLYAHSPSWNVNGRQ